MNKNSVCVSSQFHVSSSFSKWPAPCDQSERSRRRCRADKIGDSVTSFASCATPPPHPTPISPPPPFIWFFFPLVAISGNPCLFMKLELKKNVPAFRSLLFFFFFLQDVNQACIQPGVAAAGREAKGEEFHFLCLWWVFSKCLGNNSRAWACLSVGPDRDAGGALAKRCVTWPGRCYCMTVTHRVSVSCGPRGVTSSRIPLFYAFFGGQGN